MAAVLLVEVHEMAVMISMMMGQPPRAEHEQRGGHGAAKDSCPMGSHQDEVLLQGQCLSTIWRSAAPATMFRLALRTVAPPAELDP